MDSREHPVAPSQQPRNENQTAVTGIFRDRRDAQEAIQELRDSGIRPADISLITREEDHPLGDLGTAGVPREAVGDEARTYRAAAELPNDEDLPTTVERQTGPKTTRGGLAVSFDPEVPPDEPMGGSDQLGLTRDDDLVRRNEAGTNADEDIYTDFPDQPGGVNPEFSAERERDEEVQEPMKNRTGTGGDAAAGAVTGGLVGLLAGAAGLVIPGVGAVLAAGPLAAVLGGALAGGAAGGVIGALANMGVPEEYARKYAARLQEGHTIIAVHVDPLSRDLVERILIANRGEDIHC